MAEGLLRAYGKEGIEAFSAGTVQTQVRDEAITVMNELGIDISKQTSKTCQQFNGKIDVLITVCDNAERDCPCFPGLTKRLHWAIPDPTRAPGDERLIAFRSARDMLLVKLKENLEEFLDPVRMVPSI